MKKTSMRSQKGSQTTYMPSDPPRRGKGKGKTSSDDKDKCPSCKVGALRGTESSYNGETYEVVSCEKCGFMTGGKTQKKSKGDDENKGWFRRSRLM